MRAPIRYFPTEWGTVAVILGVVVILVVVTLLWRMSR